MKVRAAYIISMYTQLHEVFFMHKFVVLFPWACSSIFGMHEILLKLNCKQIQIIFKIFVCKYSSVEHLSICVIPKTVLYIYSKMYTVSKLCNAIQFVPSFNQLAILINEKSTQSSQNMAKAAHYLLIVSDS